MEVIAELMQGGGIGAVDARVLLRAVLGVDDVYLIAHSGDAVSAQHEAQFRALVARRVAGEPVAYLVGEREFYAHVFKVTPAVLIPRPETELLVELALERMPRQEPRRVLDLGTGSGCIAISIALARPLASVTATDCSEAALEVARKNAHRLGAGNVELKAGDWFGAVRDQCFDLIISNPPYVAAGDPHLVRGDLRFEPAHALAAGAAGYSCLNAIIDAARGHLGADAWLLLEHGHDQAADCRDRLRAAGFEAVQSWRDLAGIERVSGGAAPGSAFPGGVSPPV